MVANHWSAVRERVKQVRGRGFVRQVALLATMLFSMSLAAVPAVAGPTNQVFPANALRAIDRVFQAWQEPGAPGGSVAVVLGDAQYTHGYGLASLEFGAPMTADTHLHVASISKQFTAYAVALLVSQGALALGDDARRIVPALAQYRDTITVDELIHHTSGLKDQWSLIAMAGLRLSDVITQSDILALVGRQDSLNFAPGQRFLYSNTGYTILAEIVAKKANAPFPAWMRQHVFSPLDMTQTTFFSVFDAPLARRAASYAVDATGFHQLPLNFANYGATGLQTTANDMAKWLRNLMSGTPLGGARVAALIRQPAILNDGRKIDYGSGLQLTRYRGAAVMEHGGEDAGYRAYVFVMPEKRLGVAILSNRADANGATLARKVADVALYHGNSPPGDAGGALRRLSKRDRRQLPGQYQLEEGPVVSIVIRHSHLELLTPFFQPLALRVLGPGRFGIPALGAPATVKTRYARKRANDTFVLTVGTDELVGERFAWGVTSPAGFDRLVGRYRSDALDATYCVTRRGKELHLVNWRLGDTVLRATDRGRFIPEEGPFGSVRFITDRSGQSDGFEASDMRAKRVPFRKVDGHCGGSSIVSH